MWVWRTLYIFTKDQLCAAECARAQASLGYSVEVTQAGDGLSSRGTRDDALMSGDSLRKLLVKMESQVTIASFQSVN